MNRSGRRVSKSGEVILGVVAVLLASLAPAQSLTYYDSSGRAVGKADAWGSKQYYKSPNGSTVMYARTSKDGDANFYSSNGFSLGKQDVWNKSSVVFRAANGSTLGTARRSGNGFNYYDQNGRLIGREERAGTRAYFYDSSGRRIESASIWNPKSSSSSTAAKSDSSAAQPTPLFAKRIFEPLTEKKK